MSLEKFKERRFQSAADHYLVGRAPYPQALIERVVQSLALERSHRILDLGFGPAQLAVAFAPYVHDVLAMDPEPHMLALAREASSGLSNVKVLEGSSEKLGLQYGRFQAVMIGRAFHWMNREETLERLSDMVSSDGAVVLFGDERPLIPENEWVREYEALLERYSDNDEPRAKRRSDAFGSHLSVLLDSPFSSLERVSFVYRRALDIDDLVERALSQSGTSHARLGTQADVMIEEIKQEAKRWKSTGDLIEVLASGALIARRAKPLFSGASHRMKN